MATRSMARSDSSRAFETSTFGKARLAAGGAGPASVQALADPIIVQADKSLNKFYCWLP